MKETETIVLRILKTVILKKNRGNVIPESRLREDLGIDSIKMIAMAAMLKEEGIDVITNSNVDLASIETVYDVIELVDGIRMAVN